MELSTVIGISLGTVAVFVGMVIKGAPITALINPAAFLIIIGGTIGAVMNALPMDVVKRAPVLLKKIFNKQNLLPIAELVGIFVEFSQIARREGLLALEGKIESIDDPFLKGGMQMMIDGLDGEFIRDVLEADISNREERHRQGAGRPRPRHLQRLRVQPAAVPDVGDVPDFRHGRNRARTVRPYRGGIRARRRLPDRILVDGLRALLAGRICQRPADVRA